MKQKNKQPKLRFPQFDGDWEEKRLGEIGSFFSGGTPSSYKKDYYNGSIPFIKSGEIGNSSTTQTITELGLENSSAKIVEKGDLLYAMYGATAGQVAISKVNGAINQAVLCIKISENKYFLYLHLEKNKYRILGTYLQGGQGNLSSQIIKSFKFHFPSLAEQEKIADFFSTLDAYLEQKKQRLEFLQEYKRGMMQQLFSGQKRFQPDAGGEFPAWKKVRLGETFKRVRDKNKNSRCQNVLTISAQMGLISQLEYFNKSVAGKDLSGYYLLKNGDFAYNKSYSKGYPMGAIKCLDKYSEGIVSTLYICFRLKQAQDASLKFFAHFFESGKMNKSLHQIAQEGARNHGLLNMSIDDFFNIKIPLPSIAEQKKIAEFLEALDDRIKLVEQSVAQLESWKKGLLQELLV